MDITNIQEQLESTKAFVVPVSKIKPETEDRFKINGRIVPVSKQAFKDLLKIVGMTKKTVSHLNDNINDQFGWAIVKQLMNALGERKGMQVKVMIDLETNTIVRIAMAGENIGKAVPVQTFVDLIKYLQDSNNIAFKQQHVTDGGTKISMSLTWSKELPLAMKGEDIGYGKEISWDMFGDVLIQDFVERLVCTNGMTGFINQGGAAVLNAGSSPTDWYNTLVKSIANPDPAKIKEYEKYVFEAMQTNLSVNEYNKVKAHTVNHWKGDMPRIVRYLGNEDWKHDYKGRGIELDKLTLDQLKNCPTPVNKWDAINLMTDLASHDYVSNPSAKTKIVTQNLAGKMLRKRADEDTIVHNVPKYGRSKPGNF